MTQEEAKNEFQKTLSDDLKRLQKRVEHYEEAVDAGKDADFAKTQVAYYQAESTRVRSALLALNAPK